MGFTDVNHTVKLICHVVDSFFSMLPKIVMTIVRLII